MKHLFFSLLTIALVSDTGQLFAQADQTFDQRLLTKFSETELEAMSTEDRDYWNAVAKYGFRVFEISKEKSSSEVETLAFEGDVSAIDPFKLKLTPQEAAVQTYRLGNTDFGIMVLSEAKIRAKMARLKN